MVGSRGTTGTRVLYMDDRRLLVSFMGGSDSVILCDKIRNAERDEPYHVIMDHVFCFGYLSRSLDYFKAKVGFEANEMQHLAGAKMENGVLDDQTSAAN